MISGLVNMARRMVADKPISAEWDAFFAEAAPAGSAVVSAVDFDQLQEDLSRAGADDGRWTADGRLIVSLELEPQLVADLDRLADLHGLADRWQVLQKGVEVLKLLSSKSTYNRTSGRKITVLPF